MIHITSLHNLEENVPFKAIYKDIHIVLYKTTKGIFALKDECSHEQFPLSDSEAHDGTIECQHHGSVFDLATGTPLSLPAFLPVQTFPVVIKDDEIYIDE